MKNPWMRTVVVGCTALIVACGGGGSGNDAPARTSLTDSSGNDGSPSANAPPVADAGDDDAAPSEQTVTLSASGSRDPENRSLTYSWTQRADQPQVTLNNANSAQVTFTSPAVTEDTVLAFTVTVTDPAGQTDDDTVAITISPPITVTGVRITSEPQTGDTYDTNEVVIVEVTFSGIVHVTDGGPTLALDIGGGTVQARYSTGDGTNALTFRHGIRQGNQDADGIGIAANALQAGQGGITGAHNLPADTDLGDHAIEGDANHKVRGEGIEIAPPTANAGLDREALEGTKVTLNASASTSPGGHLHYAWTQAAGGKRVTITNAHTARATVTVPNVSDRGKITFTLEVTDDFGRTSTDEVAVKVLFKPLGNFYQQCANPRTGLDANRKAFPDQPGTAQDEKNFLRSFSNETYLWYDEIDYIDPTDARYSVADYFDRMRTFARTASGNFRDRFHFTWPTDRWVAFSESGTSLEYGFEPTTINGEVVVLHTEPDSPADRNDLSRGARIVSVDGQTYTGGPIVDFLYPRDRTAFEYAFEVRDLGAASTRTFNMQAEEITIDPVRYTRVIETDAGDVGYLFFSNHNQPSEAKLVDAFQELARANVVDLVLDLRYNGGGLIVVANQVAFMIAGAAAASGRVFDRLQFNDKHPSINPLTRRPIDAGLFRSTAHGFSAPKDAPLPSLNLERVFVLATEDTCSASESIINGLRGIDVEVVLIGDTTCGKPYGFYAVDNCGTTYFTIQFRSTNDKGFGDYADGFSPQNTTGTKGVSIPGCAVADDPEHALGDIDEALLAAALRYRTDGSCPAPSRLARTPVAVGDTPRNIAVMTEW